ncbi:methyl-accepting chemotaxis protein [Actimicrobium antarcticum]|uniref:Methyl-accepting chemotaxis protein n=1 Tax=Actimicrobium antarcticum TaxID=1051899 RepID=A0ABP7SQN7_9BURK
MQKFFRDLPIGLRLALGFAVILLLSLVSIIIGVARLSAVAGATRELLQEPLATERLIGDWYRNIAAGTRRTAAIARSSDPSLAAFFAEDQASSTRNSGELQKAISEKMHTPSEKALFEEISALRKIYLASRDTIVTLKKDGKLDEANQLLDQTFTPASKAYISKIEALLVEQRRRIDQTAIGINATYEASRNLMSALGVLTLVFSVLCAWLLSRSITRPLAEAVATARQVAAGDLSANSTTATSRDETGQLLEALHQMTTNLSTLVAGVRVSTDNIGVSAQEIASGNADLSSRTEAQAGSLEETASSMEQLTSTVRQNADNARQASQLATSASEVAAKGGAVVGQVVAKMGAISDSSRKIADIISVIDGIAFQTNILALNAAVEAARAGEQGRGFAVVASEVRSLAQRSASAAKEIKSLIDSSVEQVEQGSRLVNDAGMTMNEVVASVQQVAAIMSDITQASQEQSAGIEQVNLAMAQMDEMTQQNAALVEQAAAAAESMRTQAVMLAADVSVFKIAPGMHAAQAASGTAAVPMARPTMRVAAARTAIAKVRPVQRVASKAGDDWEEF